MKNNLQYQSKYYGQYPQSTQQQQTNISIDNINNVKPPMIPTLKDAQNILHKKSFIITQVFGQGAYGLVVQVKNLHIQLFYAVKILEYNQEKSYQEQKDEFLNEVNLLNAFDHSNIVKILDYFEEDKYFFIFLEECIYNIEQFKQSIMLEDRDLLKIWSQLVDGLYEIQKKGVILRDIKPDNILINSQGVLKYSDFGLAIYESNIPQFIKGNFSHMAPEIFELFQSEKKGIQNKSSEIYSLGLMMYYLQGGEQLKFGGVSQFDKYIPIQVSESQNTLLKDILQKDQNNRLKIEQLKQRVKRIELYEQ